MYDHARQQGEGAFQVVPYPDGKVLARGVFQTRNVIEIVVIEPVVNRQKRGFQIREVQHPTRHGVYFAADMNFDTEGVAVKTGAFMSFRDMGETVRRLERKDFEDFHVRNYIAAFALWSFFQSDGDVPTVVRKARAK